MVAQFAIGFDTAALALRATGYLNRPTDPDGIVGVIAAGWVRYTGSCTAMRFWTVCLFSIHHLYGAGDVLMLPYYLLGK